MKSIREYNLIQQTPMIHFQHEHAGACLRGSEVKSKLDKFLYQNVKTINDDWYIDKKQSKALNYKVKIIATGDPADIEEPNKSLFFGNMGSGSAKKPVMYNDKIILKIVCFIPELLAEIDSHIEAFFLLHNFGTRQNKGFGSFVLEQSINSGSTDALLAKYAGKARDIYKIQYDSNTALTKIFDDIALFSNVLKSGYNRGNIYVKSYLVTHCLDKDKHGGQAIGGDKRWLKSPKIKLAPLVKKRRTPMPDGGEMDKYRYNRALLGSAGNYSFINSMGENDRPNFKDKVLIDIRGNGAVRRIPSPVMYKIAGNTLYVIVREHPEAVYGAVFKWKTDRKTEWNNAKELKVPYKNEVDIRVVFADYVDEINNPESKYRNSLDKLGGKFIRQKKNIEIIGKGVKK